MAEFAKAFARTVGLEGGYSDDPDDPGGPTRYGITQAEARAAGYQGDMREFPITLAQTIYRARYWDTIRGDEITWQDMAEVLFDCGVNIGVETAVRQVQRALNLLNLQGKAWPDLTVDGKMGPETVNVLQRALASEEGPDVLETAEILHGGYYAAITEAKPAREKFFRGWLRNRVALRLRTGTA